MKNKQRLLATMLAGLLLIQTDSRAEVICEKVRPLKPVRCICGELIGPDGGPISGAMVKVVKDGTDIAIVKTGADGKFMLGELKSGNYELDADFDGLLPFRSPVVLANPEKRCNRGLFIALVLSYPDNCGSRVIGMKRMGLPKTSN
jgi:hypothetical protein